jgi:hypothetical protein
MSSMINDIQSIINNNVSEFIRIISDIYKLDTDELHNTWGDISLGKESKKSNDVKTKKQPTKKQIEKEEKEEEENEENEEEEEKEIIDKACPYKFSKGVRQGEICGIKANKGTHCSKHKKYEKDVTTKSKNTRTTAKPDVKQNAKTDSKPVSKPDSKPDSKPVAKTEAKTYAKPISVSDYKDNLPDYLNARTGDLKSLMNTNILEFVKYRIAPFMYNSVTGLILKSNKDATIVAKVVDNILLPLQESEIKLCESRNFKYDTKFYFDEIYNEEISENVLESTTLPESILQLFKIIKNQLSEDSCNEKTEKVKHVEEEVQEEEEEVQKEVNDKLPKLSHISALEAIEKIKESIIESSDSDDEIITRKEEKKTNTKTSSKKDITSDSDDDIYTRKQKKNTITKTSSKNNSKTSSKKYITSDSDSDDEIITRKDKKKTITKKSSKNSSKTSSKKDIASDSDSADEIITRKDKKKTSSKKDITSDSDEEIITRKEEKQDKPAYIRLSQRSYSSLSSDLDEYLYTDSDESETENKLPNRNIDKSKYISATEYIRKNSVNDSEDELEEELELEEDEE